MGSAQGRRSLTPRSLTTRLSLTLAATTLAVATCAGIWSYHQAFTEASDLQDDVLRQVGTIVAATSTPPEDLTTDRGPLTDTASDIDVTTLAAADLPATAPAGLATRPVNGEERRVLRRAARRRRSGRRIAAGRSPRPDRPRRRPCPRCCPSCCSSRPCSSPSCSAYAAVLRPVNRLATDIGTRDARDLGPVDVDAAPTELRGFLLALNTQLARTQEAVDHERLFIAQAAHELRTPLTAMSLQLENAVARPRRGPRAGPARRAAPVASPAPGT